MEHERITLDDNAMSAMVKLADGNPGALRVVMELFTKGPQIDPDAALGGFANLFSLDTHGIYGSHIWQLYKDVCDQNLTRVVGLFRAVQLGFLSERDLKSWLNIPPAVSDIDKLVDQVRARLPAFGQPAKASQLAA
jgi:hypothetical protein